MAEWEILVRNSKSTEHPLFIMMTSTSSLESDAHERNVWNRGQTVGPPGEDAHLTPAKDEPLICQYGNILVLHFLHSNVDVSPAASEGHEMLATGAIKTQHLFYNCGIDIVFTIFLLGTDGGG